MKQEDQDKADKLIEEYLGFKDHSPRYATPIINDMWSNNRNGKQTISSCDVEGCGGITRMGGLCNDCLVLCLDRITGKDGKGKEVLDAIAQYRNATRDLGF